MNTSAWWEATCGPDQEKVYGGEILQQLMEHKCLVGWWFFDDSKKTKRPSYKGSRSSWCFHVFSTLEASGILESMGRLRLCPQCFGEGLVD